MPKIVPIMKMNRRILLALTLGICSYLIIIMIFGIAFYYTNSLRAFETIEIEALSFFDSLYFSMATFSTIGYGEIIPFGNTGKILVFIESCIGLVFIPTLGGYLAYLFIQRPKDYCISDSIFVRPINGKIFLSARIGNKGKTIVDCEATLEIFLIENNLKRTIFKYNFSKPLVEISWYLNLRLDDTDGVQALNSFKNVLQYSQNCAIRITMKGHDSLTGNMVHLFNVYKATDIQRGGKFLDIYTWNGVERNVISWNNFNKTESISKELNSEIDRLLSLKPLL